MRRRASCPWPRLLRIPNPKSPIPAAVTMCGYSVNDPAALKKSDFH
ncbi:tRNA preQ1(34) S-adenosylmethionine ribosyltransferase-isomerase QueA, partial [Xanthomonas oryzae pv. oryzae]